MAGARTDTCPHVYVHVHHTRGGREEGGTQICAHKQLNVFAVRVDAMVFNTLTRTHSRWLRIKPLSVCAPWANTLPPWAHRRLHRLAWRVRRHLADTARLAQPLPQVHSVLRATTVWVEPVINRHAVRTQASTAQLDLHLQQERSALLVFTVREVRVTSNRVPWALILPILAPLSTAQSARPGRFQHLQALCQKVLVPSVQQEKRRNWAAMISQIAPRLPQQARMRFGSLFLCQFHSHPLPRTSRQSSERHWRRLVVLRARPW